MPMAMIMPPKIKAKAGGLVKRRSSMLELYIIWHIGVTIAGGGPSTGKPAGMVGEWPGAGGKSGRQRLRECSGLICTNTWA